VNKLPKPHLKVQKSVICGKNIRFGFKFDGKNQNPGMGGAKKTFSHWTSKSQIRELNI
jgi:hypothetical protein